MAKPLVSGLFAWLLLAGVQAHAETYRWVDGQGQVHFDTVRTRIPAEFRVQARRVTLPPQTTKPRAAAGGSAEAPSLPAVPSAPSSEPVDTPSLPALSGPANPFTPASPTAPAAPTSPARTETPHEAPADSPDAAEQLARCRSEFKDYCSHEYWETRNSELADKLQQELRREGATETAEYPLGRRVYLTQACRKLIENFPQKLDLMRPQNRPDSCLERSRIVERAIETIAHALAKTTGP